MKLGADFAGKTRIISLISSKLIHHMEFIEFCTTYDKHADKSMFLYRVVKDLSAKYNK